VGPTHPPIKLVLGSLFLVVKRPELEADHAPPSSAEVKNAWSYTTTPPTLAFMAPYSVKNKAQEQLYLLPR